MSSFINLSRLSFVVLALVQCLLVFAQPQVVLRKFKTNKIFTNAGISLLIVDANTGRKIVSLNPDLNLTPASTLKLITTATALEMFGPDYRFETQVVTSGRVSSTGVLDGDLYVLGSGDPTLGSEYSKNSSNAFFETVLKSLRERGITEIGGRIIGDESAYNTEILPPKITWEDMGNYYAAGVSALNYGDNSYRLTFQTGKVGTLPQIVQVNPKVRNLSFQNFLTVKANDKDSAYLYGMPFSGERFIYGSLPADKHAFVIKGDVPDPALFAVDQLKYFLQEKGIRIPQMPTTSRLLCKSSLNLRNSENVICRFYSDPLSQIIQVTNKRSNNFFAESLLRMIAVRYNQKASLPVGIAALKRFWADKGLLPSFLMFDGSGLSPSDKVSASFFIQLLQYMNSKSSYKSVFRSSLAVAGVDGTLRSFLANSSMTGKVMAKSGSFEGVISYCGEMDKGEKKMLFCVIVNAFTCQASEVKKSIEQLLIAL